MSEPAAYQVWWGLMQKQPHWPPYKTYDEAREAAQWIKSNTEIRALYSCEAISSVKAYLTNELLREEAAYGRNFSPYKTEKLRNLLELLG